MIPYQIIRKKRDGEILTNDEINDFIRAYVSGEIPEYQMSAFLMSIFFRGMTPDETTALTRAYIASGDSMDYRNLTFPTSDKHSTGGIGDKISLMLAPMVAACGVGVPMISGRGLGHTGGTLDKLESIPNFSTKFSPSECAQILHDTGLFIVAQSSEMVPADKKIYALRDVTSTVESIPLIVASIMSKKLAEGAKTLVLDVKCGNGAFMRTPEDAEKLARAMVDVGNLYGVPTIALITNMDQPLGTFAGNALEVREAVEYLRTEHMAPDLHEINLALCSVMLVITGVAQNLLTARTMLEQVLRNGDALRKFAHFVTAQKGNAAVCENIDLLPKAPICLPIIAECNGFIKSFDTFGIGMLAVEMGAGRKKTDDILDYAVGFAFHKKIGDTVSKGDILAEIYAQTEPSASFAAKKLRDCIEVSAEFVPKPVLISKIIDACGTQDFTWEAQLFREPQK